MPAYLIIYERTRTGWSAYAPDLPGCVAAARTQRQTERLMRDAIAKHLETMIKDGDPIPRPITTSGKVGVPMRRQ
jgi:predicted RNase H-like HicB family nuclease